MTFIKLLLLVPILYFFMVIHTILHEMGHAIVLWLFTKQPVNIYIGSYGDKNGHRLKIGNFIFFITKHPLKLYYGMCNSNLYGPPWKCILMFASGSIFALLVAAAAFYYPFFYPVPGLAFDITYYFFIYSAISLLYNLFPRKISSGFETSAVNNDGYWIVYYIKLLFKNSDFRKKHEHLTELWNRQSNDNYLQYFKKYYQLGFRDQVLLNTAFVFSFNSGNFGDAIIYLKDLEKLNKLNETDYYYLGYSQFTMGMVDEALVSCKKALEMRPGHGPALSLKTDIYLSINNHDELKKIEQLAEKHPTAPLNALLLTKIAYNTGRLNKAFKYISKISEAELLMNFELFTYRCLCHSKLGHKAEAKEFYKHPVVSNNFSENQRINCSLIHLNLEEYTEAIELLLNVLETNRKNYFALNNMSHALNIAEKYSDAIDYANKGISVNPNKYYCYSNKAFAELMLGRLEEGWQTNQKAAELNPHSSYVLRNMGIYYMNTCDMKKAKEYLIKSYTTDPTTHKIRELANTAGIELIPLEN